MDSLTLKPHNSFQNKNNKKATYSCAPRSLTFKFEKEVLKFSDICVNWGSPKTDLEVNLLNLENQNVIRSLFLNGNFKVTNLFISLIELKSIHLKYPLKENRCKFKVDKTTYSKRRLRYEQRTMY